jgi:CRP-like cAMP-binding protein
MVGRLARSYDRGHMPTDSRIDSLPRTVPLILVQLLPADLLAACTRRTVARGHHLFLSGQRPAAMHYLEEGEIVLQRVSEAGDPLVLRRLRCGFIAEASLQASSYHCDAIATAPSCVASVPVDALAQALRTDPAFAMRWIGMLSGEVRRLRTQCERLSLKGVTERLMHLVDTEGDEGRLAVPAGLKSLASELGVTHEALYRTLARLEREGRLRREAGALVRPRR